MQSHSVTGLWQVLLGSPARFQTEDMNACVEEFTLALRLSNANKQLTEFQVLSLFHTAAAINVVLKMRCTGHHISYLGGTGFNFLAQGYISYLRGFVIFLSS